MRTCSTCGVQLAADARFCPSCGTPASNREGYCPTCHQVRPAGTENRCGTCSTVLLDVHAGSLVGAGSGSPPPPAPPAPPAPPSYGPPPPAYFPPAPVRRPARGNRRGLVVVAALLLGAGGITTAVVLRNDDGSAKRPTTTTGIGATASPANPSVTVAGTGTGPPTTTVTAGSVSSGQVTVVSSNAYSSDGTLAIDGETRSMTFVAELRNDGTTTVRVGKAVITAKDAAGNVIGTRRDYPFDVMLSPGETTFLYEFTPSMMYGSDETNSFPEGMATWDLDVPAEADEPGKYDEVNLGVEGVSVTPSGEPVNATGTIRNTSDRPLTANTITVYVALHDADGRLVNVGWTYVEAAGVTQLDPGATMPFEVGVHEGPEAYASWVVGALGSPTL